MIVTKKSFIYMFNKMNAMTPNSFAFIYVFRNTVAFGEKLSEFLWVFLLCVIILQFDKH